MGPANVRLTAEEADGWLPYFFDPAKAADVWGEDLVRGAELRDPSRQPLEIVAPVHAAICHRPDDAPRIRDAARPMIALYIGGIGAKGRNFYNDVFARFGYEREATQIQDLFLAGRREEAAALIPDRFLEATTLVGDVAYMRERIAAHREAGVTCLNVTDPERGPPHRRRSRAQGDHPVSASPFKSFPSGPPPRSPH